MARYGIYQKLERSLIKSFCYICEGLVLVHRHFLKPRNVKCNSNCNFQMEILFSIISFFLLIALFALPILLFRKLRIKKLKFLYYIVIVLAITLIILIIMGWWSSKSTEILLSQNGYNFDAMNENDRYLNVPNDKIETVKNLEISMNGIGWTAKVIIFFPFFFLYSLFAYPVMVLINKRK